MATRPHQTALKAIGFSGLIPVLAASLVLSACTTPQVLTKEDSCHSATILLDAHFEGGNLGKCTVNGDGNFELTLFPEDEPPINKSPWYAFRASGQAGDEVSIRMTFQNGYARYWPKVSRDGESWAPLDKSQVVIDANGLSMELDFELDRGHLWVAAQEILAGAYYTEWLIELESNDSTVTGLLGRSTEGRPIFLAETQDRPEMILLMGRQHPPEVTGTIAMRSFVRAILGESDLARQFRGRFKLVIVPLVNPDGVAAGHWRHNVNGVDVNRDWGPFTQAESQAVDRWIRQREARGMKLSLMLDFHSTREDLFYTQAITDNPVDFASLWLGASAARLSDFPFKHEAGPVTEQANSKNYYHASRGIPAITYESGDETDRERLRTSAVIFAEEMMRTLLESR